MSKMSELHAELKRVDDLLDDLESNISDIIRSKKEGDYFVALMNIANHPDFDDDHLLVRIARKALNGEPL